MYRRPTQHCIVNAIVGIFKIFILELNYAVLDCELRRWQCFTASEDLDVQARIVCSSRIQHSSDSVEFCSL